MTDYSGLIAKLKVAAGPDRYLDFEIDLAIRGRRNLGGFWCEVIATGERVRTPDVSPKFTEEIADAIHLVPDGCWWSCGHCKRENHASVGLEVATSKANEAIDGFGASVAIAITTAALLMRQSLEGPTDNSTPQKHGGEKQSHSD